MSSSLDAAALARKERLAQLKSLKRKQPTSDEPLSSSSAVTAPSSSSSQPQSASSASPDPPDPTSRSVDHLLSGRNYDVESRAPKLGFASAPSSDQPTLESVAEQIAKSTLEANREEEAKKDAIDLFSLQPKKPNWDLKRDVEKKLERLDARTEMAIAKLIRQRLEEARKAKAGKNNGGSGSDGGGSGGSGGGGGDDQGVEGNLARMVEEREKEREKERDNDDGDERGDAVEE